MCRFDFKLDQMRLQYSYYSIILFSIAMFFLLENTKEYKAAVTELHYFLAQVHGAMASYMFVFQEPLKVHAPLNAIVYVTSSPIGKEKHDYMISNSHLQRPRCMTKNPRSHVYSFDVLEDILSSLVARSLFLQYFSLISK